jgi:hypothetical protein
MAVLLQGGAAPLLDGCGVSRCTGNSTYFVGIEVQDITHDSNHGAPAPTATACCCFCKAAALNPARPTASQRSVASTASAGDDTWTP